MEYGSVTDCPQPSRRRGLIPGRGLSGQADAGAFGQRADSARGDAGVAQRELEVMHALGRQRDEEATGSLRIEADPHVDVRGAIDLERVAHELAIPPVAAGDNTGGGE